MLLPGLGDDLEDIVVGSYFLEAELLVEVQCMGELTAIKDVKKRRTSLAKGNENC